MTMKRPLLSLTLLFLAGAGSTDLSAQEQRQKQQRPDREAMRQQILERFDLDGDGQLSETEREAMRAARAKRIQEQGGEARGRRPGAQGQDGARGRRGAQQGEGAQKRPRRERGEQGQRPSREQMVKRFDTDGDGQLNEAERQAMRKAIQQRRAEHGGKRGKRQGAGKEGRGPGVGRGAGNQGDREQRRAQLMKHFDANQDGQLDEFERQALREAMNKRRAQQGSGINPEAKQERVRQGRGNAGAPQSGLRPNRR